MQMLSLIWGILAIIGMIVGFTPCLGSLNWINIPFAVVGLVIGIIASAQAPPGRRGAATTGIILCTIAIMFGFFRLVIGGGVL